MITLIIWTFCIQTLQNTICGINSKILAFYEKLRYGYHHSLLHLREDQGQPSGVPLPTFYQEPGTVAGSGGYKWPTQKMPTSPSPQEMGSTTTGHAGRTLSRGGCEPGWKLNATCFSCPGHASRHKWFWLTSYFQMLDLKSANIRMLGNTKVCFTLK